VLDEALQVGQQARVLREVRERNSRSEPVRDW
jgi:hypothetical protein